MGDGMATSVIALAGVTIRADLIDDMNGHIIEIISHLEYQSEGINGTAGMGGGRPSDQGGCRGVPHYDNQGERVSWVGESRHPRTVLRTDAPVRQMNQPGCGITVMLHGTMSGGCARTMWSSVTEPDYPV